jgi:hypothetical protein
MGNVILIIGTVIFFDIYVLGMILVLMNKRRLETDNGNKKTLLLKIFKSELLQNGISQYKSKELKHQKTPNFIVLSYHILFFKN